IHFVTAMNSFLPERADTGPSGRLKNARPGKEIIVNQKSHSRLLPENSDLEQLKRQAKELLRAFRAGNIGAASTVTAHYHGADPPTFALHDAQLVIARSYGFESWPRLKAYVDGMTIKRLAAAVQAGDLEQVRTMLKTRPELANMQISYGNEHRP